MSIGFGGGFFAIAGFSLIGRFGPMPLDQADAVVLVMAGLYSIGVALGRWRYR